MSTDTQPPLPPSESPKMENVTETADVKDDPFSVWWNEPENEDPENPMTWSSGRKWSTIGVVSLLTFVT